MPAFIFNNNTVKVLTSTVPPLGAWYQYQDKRFAQYRANYRMGYEDRTWVMVPDAQVPKALRAALLINPLQ